MTLSRSPGNIVRALTSGEEPGNVAGGDGHAEQRTLGLIAAAVFEKHQLICRFDSLGHDFELHRMAELDDRFHDRRVARVFAQV
jgi:hypothetical protein